MLISFALINLLLITFVLINAELCAHRGFIVRLYRSMRRRRRLGVLLRVVRARGAGRFRVRPALAGGVGRRGQRRGDWRWGGGLARAGGAVGAED